MARNKTGNSYLKPGDVAELLRVEPGTVRLWAQSGRLRAATTPGGHRRFTYRDVVDFARRHGLTLATSAREAVRVLVVDDDEQICALIPRMLGNVEPAVEIETAPDGFSAGRRLAQFEPDFILLDLFMPGIDGFDLCRDLKSDPETAGMRIVAITGVADGNTAERILALGAERCLVKPFDRAELLDALGLSDGAFGTD